MFVGGKAARRRSEYQDFRQGIAPNTVYSSATGAFGVMRVDATGLVQVLSSTTCYFMA